MMAAKPTFERVRELFNYCPDTGVLTWRIRPSNRVKVGDVAGCVGNHGYIQCYVDKENQLAHRLTFLWFYGRWPENEIDHINHRRTDNRIDNLREVCRTSNNMNLSIRNDNKSGSVGVCWRKDIGKWRAYIEVNKQRVELGYFGELEEAITARADASLKYNFHPNHGSILV